MLTSNLRIKALDQRIDVHVLRMLSSVLRNEGMLSN